MGKKQKTDFFSNIKGEYNPELNKNKDVVIRSEKYAKAERQLKELGGGDLGEALKKIEEAFAKANKHRSK